jgi:hypothetical protein
MLLVGFSMFFIVSSVMVSAFHVIWTSLSIYSNRLLSVSLHVLLMITRLRGFMMINFLNKRRFLWMRIDDVLVLAALIVLRHILLIDVRIMSIICLIVFIVFLVVLFVLAFYTVGYTIFLRSPDGTSTFIDDASSVSGATSPSPTSSPSSLISSPVSSPLKE